jgi:hypothetical protein
MLSPYALITRKNQHSTRRKADVGGHSLAVYDGRERVGSLVERDGRFEAYDLEGRCVGIFPNLRAAAQASQLGRALHDDRPPQTCAHF